MPTRTELNTLISTNLANASEITAAELRAVQTAQADYVDQQDALKVDKVTGSRLMTTAEGNKLAGVATGATANATDAQLRDRATHTGVQTSSTISDLTEFIQDTIAAMLGAGSNVILNYNDAAGTLEVSATGAGGAGLDAEQVRDAIGVALVGVGNIAVTVNDAADTITITTTATQNSTDAALRARSSHTGTQTASTISDFASAVQALLGSYATEADLIAAMAQLDAEKQDALPSQTGQTGKVLGTNGSALSWVTQTGGGGGLSGDDVRALPMTGITTTAPTEEPTTSPTAASSLIAWLSWLWAWVQWLFMLIGFLPKVYNVRRYGAKGDNSTDDTAAIQAAMNAAHAAPGGILYTPNGWHRTEQITYYPDVILKGENPFYSIWIAKAGFTGTMLTMADHSAILNDYQSGTQGTILHPTITDMGFDGNNTASIGLDLNNLSLFNISWNYIRRFTSIGINTRGLLMGELSHNTIFTCGTGIKAVKHNTPVMQTNAIVLRGNNIQFCPTWAIDWADGCQVKVLGGGAEYCGTNGVNTTGALKITSVNATSEIVGAVVDGFWAERNYGTQILISGASGGRSSIKNTVVKFNTGGIGLSVGAGQTVHLETCTIDGHTTDLYAGGAGAHIRYTNSTIGTKSAVTDATILSLDEPNLLSATVSTATPDKIVLTFNELLNEGYVPATTTFTASGGKTVTAVAVLNNTVTLTVNSAYASGATITVSYTPGAILLRDYKGNNATALTSYAVTNNIAGGPSYVSEVTTDSPIYYNRMNGAGTTQSPLIGTGDITLNGTTLRSQSGAVNGGASVQFDGVTGTYGTLPIDLSAYQTIVIEFWLYPDTDAAADASGYNINGASWGSLNGAITMSPFLSNGTESYYGTKGNSGLSERLAPAITKGQWNHIVVINGVGGVSTLVVNGVVQTVTGGTNASSNNFLNTTLNLMGFPGGGSLKGRKAELAIYTALSSARAIAHYAARNN